MNMNRVALVACFVLLSLVAGCTVSDALFAVLGDYYTEGGYTPSDKRYHYNEQVEAAKNAAAQRPDNVVEPSTGRASSSE